MKRLLAFLYSLRFAPIVTPETVLPPSPGKQFIIFDGYDEAAALRNRSEHWD